MFSVDLLEQLTGNKTTKGATRFSFKAPSTGTKMNIVFMMVLGYDNHARCRLIAFGAQVKPSQSVPRVFGEK